MMVMMRSKMMQDDWDEESQDGGREGGEKSDSVSF